MAEAIEHPKLEMATRLVCPTLKFRWLRERGDVRLQQQFSVVDFTGREDARVEWRDVPTEDADEVGTAD